MKTVKYISALILVWMGIVLIGEFHAQMFFHNLENAHAYSAFAFGDDFREAAEDIRSTAVRNNVLAYITNAEFPSELNRTYTAYSTRKMPAGVVRQLGGERGLKSLVFGNISISFDDIAKAPATVSGFLRIVGEPSDINRFVTELDKLYVRALPVYPPAPDSFYRTILAAYWAIVLFYLLFLTLVETLCQRKEVFVRALLGASVTSVVVRNIISDIVAYFVLYLGGCLVLARVTSVWHEPRFHLWLFGILVTVNTLIYLLLYKLDSKAATSNERMPLRTIRLSYAIKAMATLFALLSITSSVALAQPTVKYFRAHGFFAAHRDYSFAHFQYKFGDSIFMDDTRLIELHQKNTDMNNAIYVDYFDLLQPMVLQNIFDPADNGELPYNFAIIYANANAYDYIASVISEFSTNATATDCCFLIPDKRSGPQGESAYEFAQLFVSDEAAFSVLYYTPGVEIIGVNGGSFLANEFAFWQDPVIIFDATHPRENGARQTAYTTGAMYNITDEILADIIERFALGDEFVQTTNVFEAYNHFWFMIRAGIFAAVLVSALSLVLAIVVIFRIVSLEYIANAIELCIKKTLGYSLPKRNFEIIKALAICSILSVTAAIVLLGNLSEINIVAALGAAGMLLSIDIVAVLWSGWHIEKARITKILKGGAL